jgi:uncharacterized membrane protein YfcA
MLAASDVSLFFISAAASALGGALGMASGIFIVPVLTAVMGLDIRIAIGAGIVSVIACSCASAPPLLRAGLANVRLAIVLEIATTVGAVSGVLLSGAVSTAALYAIFAAVLLVSAWQMRLRGRASVAASAAEHASPGAWARRLDSTYVDPSVGREVVYRVERLPLGLGLMYAAGLLSALLGIGSGVLKIPAMDTALRLPIKVSSATSNFMIGVTAAASAGAYFFGGAIEPQIAGPVALGSVVGAVLGARVLMFIPSDKLRLFYIVALLLLAAQMFMAAFGVHVGAGGG